MTSEEAQASTATLDGVTRVTYLRSQPARVVGNARVKSIAVCLQMQLAAEIEVSDLHPPVLVHQQVGRLQISVQNGGLVAVKLQHALYDTTSALLFPMSKLYLCQKYIRNEDSRPRPTHVH